MDWKITVLLVAAAIFILVAFLGRYELIGVPAGGGGVHGIAYRLDRWTGNVAFMAGGVGGWVEIK